MRVCLLLLIFLVACQPDEPKKKDRSQEEGREEHVLIVQNDEESVPDDGTGGWETAGTTLLERPFQISHSGTKAPSSKVKIIVNFGIGEVRFSEINLFTDNGNNVFYLNEPSLSDNTQSTYLTMTKDRNIIELALTEPAAIGRLDFRLKQTSVNSNIPISLTIEFSNPITSTNFTYLIEHYWPSRGNNWSLEMNTIKISNQICPNADTLNLEGLCTPIRYACSDIPTMGLNGTSGCAVKLDALPVNCFAAISRQDCLSQVASPNVCANFQKYLTEQNQFLPVEYRGETLISSTCSMAPSNHE